MAKKSTPKTSATTAPALTGPQQIAILQNLTPAAVGFILDMSGRTLRDQYHLPRNPNGTYDAREVVEWAQKRAPAPIIPDNDPDLERILQAVGYSEEYLSSGLIDLLKSLDHRFGDAGLALFCHELVREAKEIGIEGDGQTLTAEDVRREIEEESARELASEIHRRVRQTMKDGLRASLQAVVVCGHCGMVRRGRTWVKAQGDVADEQILHNICPDCLAKGRE